MKTKVHRLTVRLNGTTSNKWVELYGLKHNPFPQIGKAELMPLERKLAALDGDPIKDEDDLRKRLEGCSEEFIEGCCRRFKPGERVEFDITFPE